MKKLLGIFLALCMLLSLAACGGTGDTSGAGATSNPGTQTTPDASTPDDGGSGDEGSVPTVDELIVGTTNDVTAPFENFVNNNILGIGLCYDYLVYIDKNTGEITSDILESWDATDATTYVLQIKPGVTFSNGEPLTADDIIYSFQERIAQGVAQIESAQNFDWDNAEVSEDGLTLTLHTFEEYAPGVKVLNTFPIESKVQHETYGLDDEIWYTTTCGTGPYKLVEQVDGAYAKYTLRDDYWDDTEYQFTTITIKHYGDETALFTDFQNGQVHVAMNLGSYSYDQLQSGSVANAQAVLQPQGNYVYLGANYHKDYWQDENFRLAVAHCIDWDALNITGFDGLGVEMMSIFPSSCLGFEDLGGYEFDLDLAKEYLANSCYDGSSLSILGRSGRHDAAIESLQYSLSQLGVTVVPEVVEFADYIAKMSSDEFDFILGDFNTDNSGEPSNVYSSIGPNTNTASQLVTTDEWIDLLGRANTVDEAARLQALKEMQEYAQEHAIVIPLMDRNEVWAYNTTVLPNNYNCYYGGYTIFAVETSEY